MKIFIQVCFVFLLMGFLLCIAFIGCVLIFHYLETTSYSSSKPVTLEQVRRDCEYNLPIPESATDIRYSLSGSTQDWDVYLSYKINPSDLQKFIDKELSDFTEREERSTVAKTPSKIERRPINSDTLTWHIWRDAPSWWKPLNIKRGYFIGNSDPSAGPRFWINEDDNTVVFYMHHN